jgi:hypothetical protein
MFQKSKLSLTSERHSKPFVGREQHSPLATFRSAQHISVIIESPQKRVQEGSLGKQSNMNSGPYPPQLCLLVHDLSLLETIMHASAHHKIHSFTNLLPPAKAVRPLECNLHLLIRISSSS